METASSNFGKTRGDNPNFFKIEVRLCFLLGVLTTILVAVILAQVNKGDSDNIMGLLAVGGSTSLNDEDRISSLFKGFFRSPEEQNEYKLKLENAKKLSVSVSWTDKPEVENVSDIYYHHGCCYSKNVFSTPSYMTDIGGKIQLIAQFDKTKQYVEEEVCKKVPNCYTCRCTQLKNVVSLVYDQGNNTGDYTIGQFPVAGCCKCLNN